MKKTILIAGSSNLDMIVQVPRLPKPGETVLGGRFLTAHGGKGANQAVAAARAGGEVVFVSAVGNDAFGKELIDGYRQDGIETKYVFTQEDTPTGVALISVAANGENAIAVASGANAKLLPSYLPQIKAALEEAAALLVQLEIPLETVDAIIRAAASIAIPVILNPAPAQLLDDSLYPLLTCITPNESEAELLTGIPVTGRDSAVRAADWFINKGVGTVIITMGGRGAFVCTANESRLAPPFAVTPVDTTAAGDVFSGALTVALAEGMPLHDAVRFGSAAAALSITVPGAQPSIPYRHHIEQFLSSAEESIP
jgi:ribokinase